MALRPMDYFPARFDGSGNALAHWLSYEDYSEEHALNDAEKLAKFKSLLTGDARIWIRNRVFANPDALKDAFLDTLRLPSL